jgi:hypothetical protein
MALKPRKITGNQAKMLGGRGFKGYIGGHRVQDPYPVFKEYDV